MHIYIYIYTHTHVYAQRLQDLFILLLMSVFQTVLAV